MAIRIMTCLAGLLLLACGERSADAVAEAFLGGAGAPGIHPRPDVMMMEQVGTNGQSSQVIVAFTDLGCGGGSLVVDHPPSDVTIRWLDDATVAVVVPREPHDATAPETIRAEDTVRCFDASVRVILLAE
jgi:hypothetical protein